MTGILIWDLSSLTRNCKNIQQKVAKTIVKEYRFAKENIKEEWTLMYLGGDGWIYKQF